MNHPPYHLRTNKAIDRAALIAVLKVLLSDSECKDYKYYGLGGPYLEDFNAVYASFPNLKLFSIEKDPETCKRQHFHKSCSNLTIVKNELSSYLNEFDYSGKKIFWLDFTKLEMPNIEIFQTLIESLETGSVVKITLRAMLRDYKREPGSFFSEFEPLLTVNPINELTTKLGFAEILLHMLKIASEKALPPAVKKSYLPITSFYYEEPTGMLSLTGIVVSDDEVEPVRKKFSGLGYCSVAWTCPKEIDVPDLSIKEHLHLRELVPLNGKSGEVLFKRLGYVLDGSKEATINKLSQYAEYHTFFPVFVRSNV